MPMTQAATPIMLVAVDVSVVLTAIVTPEPDAGGCSATIPALPGCHTYGETLDEVRANLREAAEGWLAVAHDDALTRDAATGRP
jgi:predicted RNase H-like HicB family nuclease